MRDGGSRRVRSAQWDVAEFINQAKGAAQAGRPLLVPKIYWGGLAALEDRDGLGVVGMGKHVDRRDLEQAVAAIEELM